MCYGEEREVPRNPRSSGMSESFSAPTVRRRGTAFALDRGVVEKCRRHWRKGTGDRGERRDIGGRRGGGRILTMIGSGGTSFL